MAKRKVTVIDVELEVLRSEFAEIDAIEEPDDAQVTRSEEIVTELEALTAERAVSEAWEARLEVVRAAAGNSGHVEPGDQRPAGRTPARGPEIMRRGTSEDSFEILRTGGLGLGVHEIERALIDGNVREVANRIDDVEAQRGFERVIKRHVSGPEGRAWAMNLLARSRPEYETAWAKMVTGRQYELTDLERAAIAVGTNTAGGYLVPTHLDPTLIMTNSGVSNSIRPLSRIVTLVGGANVWNGVTTAGATASWDGELTEVSDDTPPVARVSISTYKAQALIQASIESFEDISGLTSDVSMMLADAKDRLEAAAHATGTGTAQPWGIFAALQANSANTYITSAAADTIALADLHKTYRSLPVRWRSRSTWLGNPLFNLGVKALGTAVSASYTTDLTQAPADHILGRPLVESDEAPAVQQTTTLDAAFVLGDFSNFVIVDKPGSVAIEFIPHLFNVSNNLPDGRRAWYMHWRNGSDSVNDNAFKLLVEKTSA